MMIQVCVLIVFQTLVFIATLGFSGTSALRRRTISETDGHSTECGMTRMEATSRLIGGSLMSHFTYSWFVIIHRPGFIVHSICGGALISDRHVVTAAHCFDSAYLHSQPLERVWQATLGLHDRCGIPPTAETYNMAAVIVHDNYVTPADMWDIALVTLDGRTKYTPVCLPEPGQMVTGKNRGHVAGYGVRAHKANESPCEMHEILVDVFTPGECARTEIPRHVATSAISFCAGVLGGGVDACQGDSGAPLVVLTGGRFTLQGIVSFGYGCARKNMPGVYTSIPSYIGWIQDAVTRSN